MSFIVLLDFQIKYADNKEGGGKMAGISKASNQKALERARSELEPLEREKAVKRVTDEERLSVLKNTPALLAEVDGVILKSRLHNAIMNMVTESVESGNMQVESVEDIETLLYLELLLR